MASGADYPGFPEPEPEPETERKKRKQRVRALVAYLEQEFLDLMAGILDLLKVLIASFIGALFALELNRQFAGEPPIEGLPLLYVFFGLMYVTIYSWKAGFDRAKHPNP